jgi:ParG
MTKPPFRMPPRTEPAAAQVDQWVAGGEGAAAPEIAPRPERPAGKVARLTIDLPPDLHAKFKATCALKGTRMIDEVRRFIEGWTQKNS